MKQLHYSMLLYLAIQASSSSAINDFVGRYGTYGHLVTMPQYFILHDYSSCCDTQLKNSSTEGKCQKKEAKNYCCQHKAHTINRVCSQCHK